MRDRRTARQRQADWLLGAMALVVSLAVVAAIHAWVGVTVVGTLLMGLLTAKLLLARRFRARPRPMFPPPDRRVSVVVPVHNEDPELVVAAIRSMLAQRRRPDRIHVVDDGSDDGGLAAFAAERTLRLEAGDLEWEVTRLPRNVGKRHALVTGFVADPRADVFVCVDSDTVLDPGAILEGLRPFAAPEVAAVTGVVRALNWRANLLTRLIDVRYASSFLAERAAYSAFGAVLCCCGSLSFYRADVVRRHLDDFVGQRFLGRPATFGDDRRLTNYALRSGTVVLAPAARGATAVPERVGHFLRQQVRWNKSFVRESSWVLGTFPLTHAAFWLTLVEVVGWVFMGGLLLMTLVVLGAAGELERLLPVLLLVPATAYARSAAYLEHRPGGPGGRDRLWALALAPVYGMVHLVLLIPLRIWALLTLRDVSWGTRGDVEVRLSPGSR